jgi:predicted flap endonuclease-1-like 5' DNA nuclease
MMKSEMKHGPHFEMWIFGVAAGLVAAAVMVVVGGYGWMAAGFVGAMIAVVVAFVFGLPKAGPMEPELTDDAVAVADAPVVAPPVTAQTAAVAPSAAFVSQPVPAAAPPKAAPATRPKPAAAKPAKAKADGPERLSGPRNGRADNLKEIEGIGPALEKLCNEMGFYHFDQIASWSDADVVWVDANMKNFKGRIVRDRWIAQARLIVSEGLEAFRVRARTNNY